MAGLGGLSTAVELFKELKDLKSQLGIAGITQQIANLEKYGNDLNKTMGLTKDRVVEMKAALGAAIPDIIAIGGSAEETRQVMSDLAMASKRSMIANQEITTQIFAAQKMLGEDAQYIAETFLKAGVNLSEIPDALADSMEYVRSIGGNANVVTKEVLNNMDKINRFQFEGGVVGLTKMAAQASMLRFDMGETFRLADDALDPERAIELSSAFQRLGVSAGNLVDPFQLMQQSITDPQGLQNSLVNMSKQFTYFDEKTKSFRINPQGMMMLREIGKQTGLNAAELQKMGLAASELDSRLSQISPEIVFKNEEDKQYLANIASMNEGGEYVVETKDEGTKKLSEISQKQLDALIEDQKRQPKNLEEVAYKQLQFTEKISKGIESLVTNFTLGIASSKTINREVQGVENIIESTLRNVQKNVTSIQSENIRSGTDESLRAAGKLLDKVKRGEITEETFKEMSTGIKEKFNSIISNLQKDAAAVLEKSTSATTGGSAIEGGYNSMINQLKKGVTLIDEAGKKFDASKTVIHGTQPIKSDSFIGNVVQKMKVEFDNINMNLNLNLPDSFKGLSTTQIEKILSDTFSSNDFKDRIRKLVGAGSTSLQQSGQ